MTDPYYHDCLCRPTLSEATCNAEFETAIAADVGKNRLIIFDKIRNLVTTHDKTKKIKDKIDVH